MSSTRHLYARARLTAGGLPPAKFGTVARKPTAATPLQPTCTPMNGGITKVTSPMGNCG